MVAYVPGFHRAMQSKKEFSSGYHLQGIAQKEDRNNLCLSVKEDYLLVLKLQPVEQVSGLPHTLRLTELFSGNAGQRMLSFYSLSDSL